MLASATIQAKIWQDIIPDVVVMEDNVREKDEIVRTLQILGCKRIYSTSNRDEAMTYIRPGVRQLFILDADLGQEHEFDGFVAARQVRAKNHEAYVSILSQHGRNRYKKQLEKFGINYVSKPVKGIAFGVKQIVDDALSHFHDSFLDKAEQIEDAVGKNDEFAQNDNEINFLTKMRDEEWVNKYYGLYVAFIDGKHVATNEDIDDLIVELRKFSTSVLVFVAQVGEDDELVDIPTPFFDE